MTRTRPRRLRALALAALVAVACALPFASPAAPPLPGGTEKWTDWRERLAEARDEVESARKRAAAADEAVAHMRHRRRPRGEAREKLLDEREAARAALAEAERALEETLEAARRDGVPPGWLEAAPE
jgi:hypothetical protein